MRKNSFFSEPVYNSVNKLTRLLWKFQGLQFNISGVAHIPDTGAAIITINHISYLDFLFAGIPAFLKKRHIRYVVNHHAFKHKIGGPLLRSMQHISINRADGTAGLQTAQEKLIAGELVGIFPEGRISRSFELDNFKLGAAKLALATKAPLIPLVLWGSQRIWTPGHSINLGRSKLPIFVVVGAPIFPTGNALSLTTNYKNHMQKLLTKLQKNYPAPAGAYWLPNSLGGSAPTLIQAQQEYDATHNQI